MARHQPVATTDSTASQGRLFLVVAVSTLAAPTWAWTARTWYADTGTAPRTTRHNGDNSHGASRFDTPNAHTTLKHVSGGNTAGSSNSGGGTSGDDRDVNTGILTPRVLQFDGGPVIQQIAGPTAIGIVSLHVPDTRRLVVVVVALDATHLCTLAVNLTSMAPSTKSLAGTPHGTDGNKTVNGCDWAWVHTIGHSHNSSRTRKRALSHNAITLELGLRAPTRGEHSFAVYTCGNNTNTPNHPTNGNATACALELVDGAVSILDFHEGSPVLFKPADPLGPRGWQSRSPPSNADTRNTVRTNTGLVVSAVYTRRQWRAGTYYTPYQTPTAQAASAASDKLGHPAPTAEDVLRNTTHLTMEQVPIPGSTQYQHRPQVRLLSYSTVMFMKLLHRLLSSFVSAPFSREPVSCSSAHTHAHSYIKHHV